MKILMEENVVAEVRIGRELRMILHHRSRARFILQEQTRKPPRNFLGRIIDSDELLRAGGAFDFEIITVVMMEALKRFDEQVIDRHPDWSAPIRVAAEKSAQRFAGPVANFQLTALTYEAIRIVLVTFRKRTHAVVGKEFRLVQQTPQQALHAMSAQEREQMTMTRAFLLPARDELGEVGTVFEKPLQPCIKVGQSFEQFGVEHFDSEERNQPNHGTDFESDLASTRRAQFVVIKFIVSVPQSLLVLVRIDCRRDAEKVLEEFRRDVLVHFVVQREFERDAHEVE